MTPESLSGEGNAPMEAMDSVTSNAEASQKLFRTDIRLHEVGTWDCPVTRPPTMDMLVAKQAHLSDPGNERGIHSKDPAAKASAMQALRTVISMQENIESPTTRAELTIQQKREEYGLEAPNKIDSARWDVAAEGEAPDYAHQFGIAPDVVKQAMTEYVRIVQRMEPLDDAALDQLEAKYQARGDRNQSPPPTASGSARIG